MFILNFIVPTINWTLLLSKLIVPGNIAATANNIISDTFTFRLGITVELIMALGLIVLAAALYTILKSINKYLALLALVLKIAEATLTAVIVLISFIALELAGGSGSITAFSPDQLRVPIGLMLSAHTEIFSLPMFVLGFDLVIFSYLFLKSGFIPKWMAWLGIIAFTLIFIHAVMTLLTPEAAKNQIAQAIFWTPSALFELITGTWLLVKGINTADR